MAEAGFQKITWKTRVPWSNCNSFKNLKEQETFSPTFQTALILVCINVAWHCSRAEPGKNGCRGQDVQWRVTEVSRPVPGFVMGIWVNVEERTRRPEVATYRFVHVSFNSKNSGLSRLTATLVGFNNLGKSHCNYDNLKQAMRKSFYSVNNEIIQIFLCQQ